MQQAMTFGATDQALLEDMAWGSVNGPRVDGSRAAGEAKRLGAYYTADTVAQFLLRWAVCSGSEKVLDPSFGGGVFLRAAAQRISELGGIAGRQIYGIDVDQATHEALTCKDSLGAQLLHANFFEVARSSIPPMDAVVGNPPFIRYQRFNGAMRRTALRRAQEAGVRVSSLASSWAPFVVHSVQFVKPGGKLGMVAPAELAHAKYARPVLDYLRDNFQTIKILCFSRKLFSSLSEETVLVLASGRGAPFESFQLIDLPDLEALDRFSGPDGDLPSGVEMDAFALGQGQERIFHYLLPRETRGLYLELRASKHVVALGSLADVNIGYVTGANDFFHVDKDTVATFRLPPHVLRPAVRNGGELGGLRFTRQEWHRLHQMGRANLLISVPPDEALPETVEAYLRHGILQGVPDRYKCRVREPWYRVDHVYQGDGFLTYMNGPSVKFVANQAGAVSPNTLHVVRFSPTTPFSASAVAALWQTSLTALSCEMEGHSLGGGMLKLEPKEANRVLIAAPHLDSDTLSRLAEELDDLLRRDKIEVARQHADTVILREGLGLSPRQIYQLRDAWLSLRHRRLNR